MGIAQNRLPALGNTATTRLSITCIHVERGVMATTVLRDDTARHEFVTLSPQYLTVPGGMIANDDADSGPAVVCIQLAGTCASRTGLADDAPHRLNQHDAASLHSQLGMEEEKSSRHRRSVEKSDT